MLSIILYFLLKPKHFVLVVASTYNPISSDLSPCRKYEEIRPPELKDFVYITDCTYTKKQVLQMEHFFLGVLAFDMAAPTINQFLRLFMSIHSVCANTENLAMVRNINPNVSQTFRFMPTAPLKIQFSISLETYFDFFFSFLPLVCSRVKPAGNSTIPTILPISGCSCSLLLSLLHRKQFALGKF